MVVCRNCTLGEFKVQVLSPRGQSEVSSTLQVVSRPSVVIRRRGGKHKMPLLGNSAVVLLATLQFGKSTFSQTLVEQRDMTVRWCVHVEVTLLPPLAWTAVACIHSVSYRCRIIWGGMFNYRCVKSGIKYEWLVGLKRSLKCQIVSSIANSSQDLWTFHCIVRALTIWGWFTLYN